jgi:hypothetical protein
MGKEQDRNRQLEIRNGVGNPPSCKSYLPPHPGLMPPAARGRSKLEGHGLELSDRWNCSDWSVWPNDNPEISINGVIPHRLAITKTKSPGD